MPGTGVIKIIHCADLHLDSKMNTHLNTEKARERKGEILRTFERMVEYAGREEVSAVIIAGDLFDTDNVTLRTQNVVISQIKSHPNIKFYYLRGNHDANNFLKDIDEPLPNLYLFSENAWSSYTLDESGEIVISGIELSKENAGFVYNTLSFNEEKFNILTLHGQEIASSSEKKAELVQLKELKNRGIDYLALGHIHGYKEEALDGRGVYCYPGCLEGRGYDELGEHGFVLLEIDEQRKTFTRKFIPFAYRNLYAVDVDITGCETTPEIVETIEKELAKQDISSNSLVKFVLTGKVNATAEKDIDYIKTCFENRFYFLRVSDESGLAINYEDYALDQSLKGEFVRTVQSQKELTEDEKMEIIRYGLQVIAGEEIKL